MSTTLASKCTLAGAGGDSQPRRAASAGPIVTPLLELFSIWLRRARERRQLHAFDEAMLKDIGLTRADVEFEVHKPFWRD
jgi:uncharacterized protein YjiS (DUF1127 family)